MNQVFFVGFIIGALGIATPCMFFLGKLSQQGVNAEFIIKAQQCKAETKKIESIINTMSGTMPEEPPDLKKERKPRGTKHK